MRFADCPAHGHGQSKRWRWAGEAGLPIQVHTTISRTTYTTSITSAPVREAEDRDVECLLSCSGGTRATGRSVEREDFEQVFGKIYELSNRVNFQIKTTEAMHYRRYLLQHNLQEKKMGHGPSARGLRGSMNRAHRKRMRSRGPRAG